MSELSVTVIGETETVLITAFELALINNLGGRITHWAIVKDPSRLVFGSGFSWRYRDVSWLAFPTPLTGTTMTAMTLSWLEQTIYPARPMCDGSIRKAWRLDSDLEGTITIMPDWTEYHK